MTFDPSKRPTCGSRATGPNEISSGAFTMEQLAMQLSRPVGRPVINNTGLSGGFDYDLRWAPEQTSSAASAATTAQRSSDFTPNAPGFHFSPPPEQRGTNLAIG